MRARDLELGRRRRRRTRSGGACSPLPDRRRRAGRGPGCRRRRRSGAAQAAHATADRAPAARSTTVALRASRRESITVDLSGPATTSSSICSKRSALRAGEKCSRANASAALAALPRAPARPAAPPRAWRRAAPVSLLSVTQPPPDAVMIRAASESASHRRDRRDAVRHEVHELRRHVEVGAVVALADDRDRRAAQLALERLASSTTPVMLTRSVRIAAATAGLRLAVAGHDEARADARAARRTPRNERVTATRFCVWPMLPIVSTTGLAPPGSRGASRIGRVAGL